jgi:phosphate transport system protein
MAYQKDNDLDTLKKMILRLGSKVEKAINLAMKSLTNREPDLAGEVIEGDSQIDSLEVDVEEQCFKILAVHQPVAKDLRFILTVLKVNNELERMGDQAANIAIRSKHLSKKEPLEFTLDLEPSVKKIRDMVSESIDSLIKQDPNRARTVREMDDEINEAHHAIVEEIKEKVKKSPNTIDRAIHTLYISRYLERIGDLTKNIVEDVIFLEEGDVLRHQLDEMDEIKF